MMEGKAWKVVDLGTDVAAGGPFSGGHDNECQIIAAPRLTTTMGRDERNVIPP
jgi:hypothetical protein